VARKFARRWVLRGIDLRVQPGEIVALTGRNGSGKTTLLRVCATSLRPTRGSGTIFGLDLVADGHAVREQVGLLGHAAGLYDDLTAAENLTFSLRMAGQRPDRPTVQHGLEQVGLGAEAGERVRGFSAGMRRRLALARLLLRPPRLLLLDEPFASFDADGVQRVNAFALEVARSGGAVLVATHDMARGRGVFDRRVHITDGRVSDSPLEEDAQSGPVSP
jgi:heme exporter protein A